MSNRSKAKTSADGAVTVIKIIVLGNSAVGKSSLMLRFCDNKFDTKHIVTVGVDFKQRIIETGGEKLKVQIWDTAGQERFSSITPVYFRNAMGVVLVFDVTNSESFENISHWLESIEENASESLPRILVGNKVDLPRRKVSTRRAENLAATHGIPYFETSALENLGVFDMFTHLARICREVQSTSKGGRVAGAPKSERPISLDLSDEAEWQCCGMGPTTVKSWIPKTSWLGKSPSPSRHRERESQTAGGSNTGESSNTREKLHIGAASYSRMASPMRATPPSPATSPSAATSPTAVVTANLVLPVYHETPSTRSSPFHAPLESAKYSQPFKPRDTDRPRDGPKHGGDGRRHEGDGKRHEGDGRRHEGDGRRHEGDGRRHEDGAGETSDEGEDSVYWTPPPGAVTRADRSFKHRDTDQRRHAYAEDKSNRRTLSPWRHDAPNVRSSGTLSKSTKWKSISIAHSHYDVDDEED